MEIKVLKTYKPVKLTQTGLFVIPLVFKDMEKPDGIVRIGIGEVIKAEPDPGVKDGYNYEYKYSPERERAMLSSMKPGDRQYIQNILVAIRKQILRA